MKINLKLRFIAFFTLLVNVVYAEEYSGTENGFTWKFDDVTCKMTIGGSGEINQSFTNDYCQSVVILEIGEGVTAVKENPFSNFKNLLEVDIPSTMEAIGNNVFSASTIGTIRSQRVEPPTIESNSFKSDKTVCVVFVPDGAKKLYAKEQYWKNYENIYQGNQIPDEIKGDCGDNMKYSIQPGEWKLTITGKGVMTSVPWNSYSSLIYKTIISEDVTTIANYAFSGFTKLRSIQLPSSLKTIGSHAFSNCGIKKITLPEGLVSVEEYAFANSTLNEITLPTTLVSIGNGAISSSNISSVIIPSSCASLGERVFEKCTQLKEAQLPDNLEAIPTLFFNGCSSLEQVNIPTALNQINDYAFCGTNIRKIELPATVVSVGKYTFSKCNNLETVTINANIDELALGVFEGCRMLTSVELPASVTTLGDRAFYQCSALKTLNLPKKVQTIGKECFYLSGITNIVLPESIENVGNHAFTGSNITQPLFNSKIFAYMPKAGYTTYEIPQGITKICETSFYNCRELTEIIIPSTVKIIGEQAFQNCTSLKDVDLSNLSSLSIMNQAFRLSGISSFKLPSSIKELGFGVFEGCDNLNGVFDFSNMNLPVLPTNTFSGCKKIDKVFLPLNLETIGDYCFKGCEELEDFSIPKQLSSVGQNAFEDCMSLESLKFPEGNRTISAYAFAGCINLHDVNFSEGMTNFDAEKVFNNCSKLKKVVFPASLESINLDVFTGCTKLDSIFFLRETAPIAYNWYSTLSENEYKTYWNEHNLPFSKCVICIPSGATKPWQRVGYVVPIKGYLSTAPWESLKYAEFYETLSGTYAERDNNLSWNLDTKSGNLTISGKGDIPSNLEWRRRHFSIKSITIDGDFRSIPDDAFKDCINLKNATLSETIETIGNNAFACTLGLDMWNSLKSIVLPKKLKTLGNGAFSGCERLEYVQMPDSLIVIGREAFAWCHYLKEITIPRTVTTIGASAFHECYELANLYSHLLTPIPIDNKRIVPDYVNSSRCTLHVHVGTKDRYLSTPGWEGFGSIVEQYVDVVVQESEFGNVSGAGEYEVGQNVTLEATPNDRYIFVEWSNGAKSNPYHFTAEVDVVIQPVFKADTHTIAFVIDNEVYATYDLFEGDVITAPEVMPKEGYTFSGWSEIPETMPAHDVTITGSFLINSYKLTYMIDGMVYKETMYEYGATITPEPQPEGDYDTFKWIDIPQTMPAHDVVVHASYTSGIFEILMTKQQDIRIYSPNGKRLNVPQKGVNIIRMGDGRTKKIVVK